MPSGLISEMHITWSLNLLEALGRGDWVCRKGYGSESQELFRIPVPEPSQGELLPLHVLHYHTSVHKACVTLHTSSDPGSREVTVIISHSPGPCGSYGDLCTTSLIYKEEEDLTGVIRDSSKKSWAWYCGTDLWRLDGREGTGSPAWLEWAAGSSRWADMTHR